MFTGIVEEIGRVETFVASTLPSEVARLSVSAHKVLGDMGLGDSISVNGTCLTAVEVNATGFTVELAPETMRRTNLGCLATGGPVNLERPLAVSARLGGHIVQGHVDGTGVLVSMVPEGDCMIMRFEAPENLMPYIVEKGFIAVDGVSLTVVEKGTTSFTISVIPYTLENTIFKDRQTEETINLEVDIVAKYVESLLKH